MTIPCRFVYQFKDGAVSDSLSAIHQVHSVPREGEIIHFVAADGTGTNNKVKRVTHFINPTDGTHEIVVNYKPTD